MVKGRYVEKTILQEVITENARASELRDATRDKPEDATREARMAFGELVGNAIAANAMKTPERRSRRRQGGRGSQRPRTEHEEDAVDAALLVEVSREDELEQVVDALAQHWEGLVDMRLLGPMAPYDFVVTQQPGA